MWLEFGLLFSGDEIVEGEDDDGECDCSNYEDKGVGHLDRADEGEAAGWGAVFDVVGGVIGVVDVPT